MDQRAQISIEYVLFLAMVVVIVSLFGVYVSDQSELNSVSAAVKLGAENATTNMVITNSGMAPVRVTSINETANGTNENLTVMFSNTLTSDLQKQIINSTIQSLIKGGYNNITNTTSSINLITKRHNYTITMG